MFFIHNSIKIIFFRKMIQRNIIYLKNGFVWNSSVKMLDDAPGCILVWCILSSKLGIILPILRWPMHFCKVNGLKQCLNMPGPIQDVNTSSPVTNLFLCKFNLEGWREKKESPIVTNSFGPPTSLSLFHCSKLN